MALQKNKAHLLVLVFCFLCFASQAQPTSTEKMAKLIPEYAFEVYGYPTSEAPIYGFNVGSNFKASIPVHGGIYALQDSVWLCEPESGMMAMEYSSMREAFLQIKLVDGNVGIYSCQGKSDHLTGKLIGELPLGVYQLWTHPEVGERIYGFCKGKSMVWKLHGEEIKEIASSDLLFSDMAFVKDQILAVCDSSVYAAEISDGEFWEVIGLDMPIHGIEYGLEQGAMIVSSELGIMHYGSIPSNEYNMLAYGVSGPLKRRNDQLFVLDRAEGQIVSINVDQIIKEDKE